MSRAARVQPDAVVTWQGWGTALAWEGNVVWGSALVPPMLPDAASRARFADLLFGRPGTGLGLTIARFNVGGGTDPAGRACDRAIWPRARMEGYRVGPRAPYDWSRDAGQRAMLAEALRRGVDRVELFSNAAPWWMTRNGCVSGADRAGTDDLRADAVDAFAAYLGTVARHFAGSDVPVRTVSPVNEPDGLWWVAGNHQEGSFATVPMQAAVLEATAAALRGSGIAVAGTEPNDFDRMSAWLDRFPPTALAALGQINVHEYGGSDPGRLAAIASRLGKPISVSEMGCCIEPRSAADGALRMAEAILVALGPLGARSWSLWQPDWNVIASDGGTPRLLPQFYAIAQFSRFIRPGDTVLAVSGDDIAAARSPDRTRLTVVVVNRTGATLDQRVALSGNAGSGATVQRFRTRVDDPGGLVASAPSAGLEAGVLRDRLPPRSITTYVVSGVAAGQ